MLVALLLETTNVAPAGADTECEPWGASTFRGDVQGLMTGSGVIEITPPNEFVYAVIDGAAARQQFVQIKAGLSRLTCTHSGAQSVYSPGFNSCVPPERPAGFAWI